MAAHHTVPPVAAQAAAGSKKAAWQELPAWLTTERLQNCLVAAEAAYTCHAHPRRASDDARAVVSSQGRNGLSAPSLAMAPVRQPSSSSNCKLEPHILVAEKRVISGKQPIIVACPGTVTMEDVKLDVWATDVQAPRGHSDGKLHVQASWHGGFNHCMEALPLELFRQLLGQGHTLVFTGHSKGAAVAQITATTLLLECMKHGGARCDNIKFVGFAAPPTADPKVISDLREKCSSFACNFIYYVYADDPVPQVYELARQAWNVRWKVRLQLCLICTCKARNNGRCTVCQSECCAPLTH